MKHDKHSFGAEVHDAFSANAFAFGNIVSDSEYPK